MPRKNKLNKKNIFFRRHQHRHLRRSQLQRGRKGLVRKRACGWNVVHRVTNQTIHQYIQEIFTIKQRFSLKYYIYIFNVTNMQVKCFNQIVIFLDRLASASCCIGSAPPPSKRSRSSWAATLRSSFSIRQVRETLASL